MGFFAMIICLFALGCTRTILSLDYKNRQIRQTPTTPPVPPALLIPNKNYNNTQFLYPTYPNYPSNVGQVGPTPVTNMPQTIIKSPSTNNTSLLDTSASTSLLQYVKTYSIYAIQMLMIVLLGSSLLNYICSHWSICDNVFGEYNFWKNNKAKRMNRSYATSDYLDDISSTVFKAIDYYNKQ